MKISGSALFKNGKPICQWKKSNNDLVIHISVLLGLLVECRKLFGFVPCPMKVLYAFAEYVNTDSVIERNASSPYVVFTYYFLWHNNHFKFISLLPVNQSGGGSSSREVEARIDVDLHCCDSCDFSTKWLCNLRCHEKKHSRNEKFGCPRCTYSALQPGTIVRHLKRDHKDAPIHGNQPVEEDNPLNIDPDEVKCFYNNDPVIYWALFYFLVPTR